MEELAYPAIYIDAPKTDLQAHSGERSKGGRGNAFWKNPDKIQRLKDAFSIDANITEACFYAGISRSQYYEYKQQNPDIVKGWEDLRMILGMAAKKVIAEAIFAGDLDSCWKYLSRRERDWMPRCGKCQYEESKPEYVVEDTVSDEEWEEIKRVLGH